MIMASAFLSMTLCVLGLHFLHALWCRSEAIPGLWPMMLSRFLRVTHINRHSCACNTSWDSHEALYKINPFIKLDTDLDS